MPKSSILQPIHAGSDPFSIQHLDEDAIETLDLYAYEVNGRIMGGFALLHGHDMMWLLGFEEIPVSFRHVNIEECAEINFLWADAGIRGTIRFYYKFWVQFAKIMSAQTCRYLVVGLDLSRKKLVRDYQLIMQGEIFRGSLDQYPEHKFVF